MKLKRGKEDWFREETEFLGVSIVAGGLVRPTKNNVECLRNLNPPNSVDE